MAVKAVLFDLDGVLLDTEDSYTDFWDSTVKIYPTGIDNFAHVIKGTTLTKILETYFPDKKTQDEICALLKVHEDNMPYRLFDGVENLLVSLRNEGIRTAIVTSSNRAKMERVFNALPSLRDYIDTLVTDEDVTASKPDPQGYLLAAERLGALDGDFVVVEDSIAGLEAGRRSGGKVVGIATTNPRSRIEPLADLTVDSTGQLSVPDLF